MFDIGFSELVVIGVVALVVLGPERLPKVARTAGHLFGRLHRYVATVKADLNREMDLSELSKVRQEVQEAARAFEQSAQQHAQAVETEARAVSVSLESPVSLPPTTVTAQTQAELLAAQDLGLPADGGSAAPALSVAAPARQPANMPAPAIPSMHQGMLDFGIEPVRVARP